MRKVKSSRLIVALAVTASLVAASCGGSSSTTPETVAEEPVEESTTTEKPQLTIGYLQILSQSEAAMRLENDTKAAAELFGWGFEVCDAQGTVEGMQTCGDTLVNKGVDVIITNGTPSVVIKAQIDAAIAKGIPFLNTGGTQATPEDYTASYNPNDGLMGEVLAKWVRENAQEGEILLHSVKDKWGADREASLAKVIEGSGFSVVDSVDTPFDNTLVEFTQTSATSQFTRFPKAKVLWLTFDLAALGAGPAIAASYPGKTPPDRPTVVTFYCNSTTQAEIRKGTVDACVETPLEAGTWIAIDQIASHFATGSNFSQERQPTYDGVQYDVPIVVTKETLPAEGSYPTPVGDFRTYFTNKWKTQYGL